jgi:hypothetical protein
VRLPPERAKELENVVGTMVGLQYIRTEEVATLPRRAEPFRYFTIPGAKVARVVERLEAALHANRQLEQHHQGRRASF